MVWTARLSTHEALVLYSLFPVLSHAFHLEPQHASSPKSALSTLPWLRGDNVADTWIGAGLTSGSLATWRQASRTFLTHSMACSNFCRDADCEACRICAKIDRVKLAKHLRRFAAHVHPQPRLQVDDNIQRPLDGCPAGRRITPIHCRAGRVKKADDSVIKRHDQIDRRSAVQRMFVITSHEDQAP